MVAPNDPVQLAEAADQLEMASQEPSSIDCLIQIQNKSLAQRLIAYHDDPEVRNRIFPGDGAKEVMAIEQDPDEPKTGNELVMFRGIKISPLKFKDGIDASFIRPSISRMFFSLSSQEATSYEDLMRQLSQMTPPSTLVRIYAYPKSLERLIAEELDERWELHPVNYNLTLHVARVSSTCLRFGLRPGDETFLTLPDGPPRVDGQLCRATGKLTEALAVTGFMPGTGKAIDVGAAPGGWTLQLARRMQRVVAVDPAALHPEVEALHNVVHIKRKSEEAAQDIINAVGDGGVDLICCDANRHPSFVVEMLEPLFDLLRPGGLLLFTLKCNNKNEARHLPNLETMKKALEVEFEGIRVLWLLANTINERTVVAVKRQ